MNYKLTEAYFFDFDGVILDSMDVKSEAFYNMYLEFGSDVAEKVKKHHTENGGVSRFEKIKIYHEEFLGLSLTPNDLDTWCNRFSQLVVSGVVNSHEVNGVWEFISKCSKVKPCFIITGTPTDEMIWILNELGKKQCFKEVFGSPRNKKFWVPYILNKYQFNPEKVWFFGDALSDLEAGIENNVNFALRRHKDNGFISNEYDGLKFENFNEL